MPRTKRDIDRDSAKNNLRSKVIELYEKYPSLNVVDICTILGEVQAFELQMLHKHYNVVEKKEGEENV